MVKNKSKGKSMLASKLGNTAKEAFDAHKADETSFSAGGDLPAGIEGGIARLVECKFDTFKKGDNEGEFFFFAAGVVVEPQDVAGVPVAGLRTQIMEPLCDTPSRSRPDTDAHVEWVLNELRKLGVDTSSMDFDDLEPAAEALKAEQPYFRFRTWKGQKQTTGPYAGLEPRTQHDWRGVCDYESDGAPPKDAVVDATEDDDDSQEETDLTALATAADEGDDEAAAKLNELATEAGLDAESFDTWEEVRQALEDEDEDEDKAPVKGGTAMYKAPGTKKAVECKVVSVNAKKNTCSLRNTKFGTVYKDVNWADLQ